MIQIPSDSALRYWVAQFENTELWPSWRLATGLGIIGTLLERNVMFSYGEAGKIWPNTSIMLIGRSGDGKDTMISAASRVLESAGAHFIAGTTIEGVHESLFRASNSAGAAVGYIVAPELSKFIGGKDYQEGIIEGLTDLLSNNEVVDISNKTDLVNRMGRPKLIYRPTLTMFAGTTPDWLPEDCIGGGFLGRFIVAPELGAKTKHVPNPGKYDSLIQKKRIHEAKDQFLAFVMELKTRFPRNKVQAFVEDSDGEEYFTNWYGNRSKYFPPGLEAFAARSGNLMRKVAMLMAVSRGKNYISAVDYQFAGELIRHAAKHLEKGVIPSSPEVAVGDVILGILPMRRIDIIKLLSRKHGYHYVGRALKYLLDTEQIVIREGTVQIKEADVKA
jgi:hypothetical protein